MIMNLVMPTEAQYKQFIGNVRCVLPTFDNVTILAWSCDQADNEIIQEWMFWLDYRNETKNAATMAEIQKVMNTKDPLLGVGVGNAVESGSRYYVVNTTQQVACNAEQLSDVGPGCPTK
jgi:hypothetical protein